MPHLSACFSDVAEAERTVCTNALLAGRRTAESFYPALSTAIIGFNDHPDGTEYVACVMHGNRIDRDKHEEMSLHDGWATVTVQLAALVEPLGAKGTKG